MKPLLTRKIVIIFEFSATCEHRYNTAGLHKVFGMY